MSATERTPESLGYSARDCSVIRDWHSPAPADDVAADYGIRRRMVMYIWARAVRDGLLPDRWRDHVVRAPFVADGDVRDLRAGDPLLAALRRAHGRDRRRASDDVRFDPDSRRIVPPPALLAAQARARDAECGEMKEGR
jgi:hypothetical protein